MAEQCDLSAIEQANPGTSFYRPVSLSLDWENARITVSLVGASGLRKKVVYENALAQLKALNTADLTTNSLHKRLMTRLLADGHLTGVISGAPDP